MVPVTQNTTPPTVFNLQVSNWVHCEEKTGAHYQLSRFNYKLVTFFFLIKVVNFARKKIHAFQKIKYNLLFVFIFLKRDNWAYVCMY